MTSIALPASSARLRAVVRPLARSVLHTPGSLYHPLYLLGIDRVEAIEADIQALAEAEGVAVTFLRDASRAPVARAIVVAPISAAANLLKTNGADLRQILFWGTTPVEELEPGVQEWLARGLALDPTTDRGVEQEWSMGPTLARAARERGRGEQPIVLIGPSATAPSLTQEATLRLEAGGMTDVVPALGPIAPDSRLLARLKPGSALVLHQAALLTPEQAGALAEVVETLRARSVLVVIVGDERLVATADSVARLATVFAKGLTLVVGRVGGNQAARDAARVQALEGAQWPALDASLAGRPGVHLEAQRIATGRLLGDGGAGVTLPEALLWASRLSCWLVAYTPDAVGGLVFDGGRIVGSIWGGRSALDLDPLYGDISQRILFDRALRMRRWSGGRMSLITPPPAEEMITRLLNPLDIQTVILELDRRSDESTLRVVEPGAIEHLWSRAQSHGVLSGDMDGSGTPEGLSPQAQRAWAELTTPVTGVTLARLSGLTGEEVLDALDVLSRAGIIADCGPAPVDDDTVSAEEMWKDADLARMLDSLGMRGEAVTILNEAEQNSAATPDGRFLRGIFVADHDPQAADRAFRAVALDPEAAAQLRFDADLDAALLEVRGGQTEPAIAWRRVREQLQRLTSGQNAVWTVDHALLAAEIALRAGEDEATAQILQTLDGVSGPPAERREALRALLDT